jgi:hypothetical protein
MVTLGCNVGLAVLEPSMIGEPADPFAPICIIIIDNNRNWSIMAKKSLIRHKFGSDCPRIIFFVANVHTYRDVQFRRVAQMIKTVNQKENILI